MEKDITVLVVCSLILLADLIAFWQAFVAEKVSPLEPTGTAVFVLLFVLAFMLINLNYVLIKRIIDRQIDQG